MFHVHPDLTHPNHVSFECEGNTTHTSLSLAQLAVVSRIQEGVSHIDIAGALSSDSMKDGIFHDGNHRRGSLAEHCTGDFNRVTHPDVRRHFEDLVIQTILSSQPLLLAKESSTEFKLCLTFFISGQFLAEDILMLRLINRLKEEGLKGTLHITCIDTSFHSEVSDEIVTLPPAVQQFIDEMKDALPPTIHLNGDFFSSISDYREAVEDERTPRHHLLIATDSDAPLETMEELNRATCESDAKSPPLTLENVHAQELGDITTLFTQCCVS